MSTQPHIVRWALDPQIEGPHNAVPVTCEEELETTAQKCTKLQARVFELEMALVDSLFPRGVRGMRLVNRVEDFRPDNT